MNFVISVIKKDRGNRKIWFVGDLHFGHHNVINYCNRPYKDVFEMNESITKIWNETVSENDTVYVLGDFSLNAKYVEMYLPRLNGKKILIVGNHDKPFKEWEKDGLLFHHGERTNRYLKFGFEKITPCMWITLSKPRGGFLGWLGFKKKYQAQLCHFPFAPKEKPGSLDKQDRRYLNQRPIDKGQILLHGHLHNRYRKSGKMIDVGFDGELCLLSEKDIIKLIEDKHNFIPSRLTNWYNSEQYRKNNEKNSSDR